MRQQHILLHLKRLFTTFNDANIILGPNTILSRIWGVISMNIIVCPSSATRWNIHQKITSPLPALIPSKYEPHHFVQLEWIDYYWIQSFLLHQLQNLCYPNLPSQLVNIGWIITFKFSDHCRMSQVPKDNTGPIILDCIRIIIFCIWISTSFLVFTCSIIRIC